MAHAWNAILIAGTIISIVLGSYWGVGVVRTIITRRRVPSARDGLDAAPHDEWPSLCVIVPAHNEGHCIAELVTSLAAQDYPGPMHVIVALDRCTDDTEVMIRRGIEGMPIALTDGLEPTSAGKSATIWHVDTHAVGVSGKVNAVWQAVKQLPAAHDADLLLFTDADTSFDPACVRACVNLLRTRGVGMVSLLSTLTTDTWFEQLVQPATCLELLRQYPPLRTNKSNSTRAMANGQFMLFKRDTYLAVGGHAAVKDELLEDMALAHRVKKLGGGGNDLGRAEVYFADGLLTCRMYESWPSFVAGWKRLYIDLAQRRPNRLLRNALAAGLFGGIFPVVALLSATLGAINTDSPWGGWWLTSVLAWPALVCGIIGLAIYAACICMGLGRGRRWPLAVLTYPVTSIITAWLLLTARRDLLARVPIRWGGREYVREPRRRGDLGRAGVTPVIIPRKGTRLGARETRGTP